MSTGSGRALAWPVLLKARVPQDLASTPAQTAWSGSPRSLRTSSVRRVGAWHTTRDAGIDVNTVNTIIHHREMTHIDIISLGLFHFFVYLSANLCVYDHNCAI